MKFTGEKSESGLCRTLSCGTSMSRDMGRKRRAIDMERTRQLVAERREAAAERRLARWEERQRARMEKKRAVQEQIVARVEQCFLAGIEVHSLFVEFYKQYTFMKRMGLIPIDADDDNHPDAVVENDDVPNMWPYHLADAIEKCTCNKLNVASYILNFPLFSRHSLLCHDRCSKMAYTEVHS